MISAAVLGIEVHDAPKQALYRRLSELDSLATIVGWPGEGSPLHKTFGPKGEVITTTLTVAQVAGIHEFGSQVRNIPKRPVMRETVMRNRRLLLLASKIIYNRVIYGLSARDALDQLGFFWQHRVKETFTNGRFRRLKDSTVAKRVRRGNPSTQPLVDYGHLRLTITHKTVGASYR